MKGTEQFSELLMSIHQGGLINKKTALDRAIGNDGINSNTLKRISKEFTATMNLIKKMYPAIKQTRFRNTAEFYSLFMLVWRMHHDKMVLKEPRRNKMAFEMLRRLSTGVDQLREQYRRAKAVKPHPPYSPIIYLRFRVILIVQQPDSDEQRCYVDYCCPFMNIKIVSEDSLLNSDASSGIRTPRRSVVNVDVI